MDAKNTEIRKEKSYGKGGSIRKGEKGKEDYLKEEVQRRVVS